MFQTLSKVLLYLYQLLLFSQQSYSRYYKYPYFTNRVLRLKVPFSKVQSRGEAGI